MSYWIITTHDDGDLQDDVSGEFAALGEAIEVYSELLTDLGKYNAYRKSKMTDISLVEGKLISRHFSEKSEVLCDRELTNIKIETNLI